MVLTPHQLTAAVRYNRRAGRNVGWVTRFDRIAQVLGFENVTPGEEAFAEAVDVWQQAHPPLRADGMLGPNTWRQLEPHTRSPAGASRPVPSWLRAHRTEPVSIADCAGLALNVYDFGSGVGLGRWTRRDPYSGSAGFAAQTYHRSGETVVVFRGTDDARGDVVSDAMMVPLTRNGSVRAMLTELLSHYDLRQPAAQVVPAVMDALFHSPAMRLLITTGANRIPAEQAAQARAYFRSAAGAPAYVVGHSLGGALAKIVAMQESVTAVAFNSPFMGDLRGTVPQTSRQIISVNASGDPLSLATREVGSLSHGQVITVELPAPPPPLRRTQAPAWSHPVVRIAGPAAWAAAAAWDYLRADEFIDDLVAAGKYYHSMENLHAAVQNLPALGSPITT